MVVGFNVIMYSGVSSESLKHFCKQNNILQFLLRFEQIFVVLNSPVLLYIESLSDTWPHCAG